MFRAYGQKKFCFLTIVFFVNAVFLGLLFPFPIYADEELSQNRWEAQNDLLIIPAAPYDEGESPLLLDITRAGGRLVAVGEQGIIIYSDDQGQTWQQGDVPVRLTLTAVCFPAPRHGWAVGHDGVVLHTENGGETWGEQLNAFTINEFNLAYARRLVREKKAELAQAKDEEKADLVKDLEELKGELSFRENDMERCCYPLLDVWFKNRKEGFVIGAYDNFLHTTDGGKSWTPCWDRIHNPGNLHLNAFAEADGALFIAGEFGTLYRSVNTGETWEPLDSPYDGSYFGIIASEKEDLIAAYGIGGKIASSSDRGESWKLIQTRAGAALSGGILRKDGSLSVLSYSGCIVSGPGKSGGFAIEKQIGAAWNAGVETEDGFLVLVGLKGLLRTPLDGNLTKPRMTDGYDEK